MPGLGRTCKSTGFIGTSDVLTKDAYYCGVALIPAPGAPVDSTVTVTKGDGSIIDYVAIDVGVEGLSKVVLYPFPVMAEGGISVMLTGVNAQCILFYQEY